ncbi:hypothetical protein [Acidovorax sp. SUPP2539]|uniref:hypothetical protein n=1 Tax=Acidovorax sp. SUPP2539 TaxID=2920878 RepID=UPI0023DE3E01|nr:hypothetical protein [Acidovorax sp. SUPP2539]GKS92437.1 hypothetical protein AVTE2539_23750 [Acidovorax sp. SUPP2539]
MGTIEIKSVGDDTPRHPAVSAVALSGWVTAQQPSALSNLAYANQVGNGDLSAKAQVARQDAMNRLRHTIVASAVARIQAPGPCTARSVVTVLTNNELAQTLAGLKSALGAFSMRQTTAPVRTAIP